MTLPVHVIRSARRRRTVSARLVGGRLEVRVPAGLDPAEEQRLVEGLRQRMERRARRPDLGDGGAALRRRADELDRRYFAGRARPASVLYVPNPERRVGSCAVARRPLRRSARRTDGPGGDRDNGRVRTRAHRQHHVTTPAFCQLV